MGMVATVSQPVYVEDGDGLKLMGVVGCDVTMEEIIQAMKLNRLKIYNVSQRIVVRCQKKKQRHFSTVHNFSTELYFSMVHNFCM